MWQLPRGCGCERTSLRGVGPCCSQYLTRKYLGLLYRHVSATPTVGRHSASILDDGARPQQHMRAKTFTASCQVSATPHGGLTQRLDPVKLKSHSTYFRKAQSSYGSDGTGCQQWRSASPVILPSLSNTFTLLLLNERDKQRGRHMGYKPCPLRTRVSIW